MKMKLSQTLIDYLILTAMLLILCIAVVLDLIPNMLVCLSMTLLSLTIYCYITYLKLKKTRLTSFLRMLGIVMFCSSIFVLFTPAIIAGGNGALNFLAFSSRWLLWLTFASASLLVVTKLVYTFHRNIDIDGGMIENE